MEYTVVRSKRRTLSVCVRDGAVIVRSPLKYPAEKIAEFVEKHRLWITRRLKEQQNCPRLDLSDGSEIEIFGKKRTIAAGKPARGEETVFLPQEKRETALIALLKKLTRERMSLLTSTVAERYGFRYEKITVTSARTRWGSCNAKGSIAYSFRSAFVPEQIALYLAVHELCHTRHLDHSAAFWKCVERILPDYQLLRKGLKGYSWAMKCL